MSEWIQYQRGFADRVMEVFGTSGFNVSHDGRLGYFGPDVEWYADPGDFIFRDTDGSLAVSKFVPYTIAEDDLELTIMAIERYRAASTVSEFEKARLFATGVNVRLLRARPDLDDTLTAVYQDARLRLGLGPDENVWDRAPEPILCPTGTLPQAAARDLHLPVLAEPCPAMGLHPREPAEVAHRSGSAWGHPAIDRENPVSRPEESDNSRLLMALLTPKSALALDELWVRMDLSEGDLVNRLLVAAQEMPMFPGDLGLPGASRRWDP
jgi:hypothetical protein